MTLPPKIIQGLSVRDYAYQWIQDACPLHQWCSGARGIDRDVAGHVAFLIRCEHVCRSPTKDIDIQGLIELWDYLCENLGHPAEPYIPDEHTQPRREP